MDTRDYIESGILELYVYGLLDDSENRKITELAAENSQVRKEIESIEAAVIDLSSSFSPRLSLSVFENIREKVDFKHRSEAPVVIKKRRTNWAAFLGWAAALLLLLGAAYLYTQLEQTEKRAAQLQKQKSTLQETVVNLELRSKQDQSVMDMLRDPKNTIIALDAQPAAPEAFAKVYWNRQSLSVYVDARGLPDPPEGMVYQVWAMEVRPFSATSIGVLDNFKTDSRRVFPVNATSEAQAFGITLEPSGGSESPTLEQLLTFGKI